MEEFKRRFFPRSHEKEIEEELKKDPRKYGEYMAKKTMKRLRQDIAEMVEEVIE